MTTSRTKKKLGTVALVFAGPGDPELLTLRAADLLRAASQPGRKPAPATKSSCRKWA